MTTARGVPVTGQTKAKSKDNARSEVSSLKEIPLGSLIPSN